MTLSPHNDPAPKSPPLSAILRGEEVAVSAMVGMVHGDSIVDENDHVDKYALPLL